MTEKHAPRSARLFSEPQENASKQGAVTANIDGGARGNPGPAAYGFVLRDGGGATVAAAGKYIGHATNNVAEYRGLIGALDAAQERGVRRLRVESDSELLVRQMQGRYKVKSADLKPLYERALKMSRGFEHFEIAHVRREQNREADRLVNEALDGGTTENRKAKNETRPEQTRMIRARYRGGVFVPEEPVVLAEGTEAFVTVRGDRKEEKD